MNGKKNMRRISVLVTAQTAYNLDKLAAMCGYRERGALTPWFAAQRAGAEQPAKKKQKAGRIA